MDEAVDPKAGTATHKGHTIGFCCTDCKPEWESLPAGQKDEFVTKTLKN